MVLTSTFHKFTPEQSEKIRHAAKQLLSARTIDTTFVWLNATVDYIMDQERPFMVRLVRAGDVVHVCVGLEDATIWG